MKKEAVKEPAEKAANAGTPHSQLTMQVVEHVRALIASGEVKPGDRLPPERELARELQISRSSLRAGIGFLSAMGVLKSRHGAGTFVSSGPPALDSNSLSVLGVLHGFLPWQMFEARLVLEASVAALAAERATDEHIAELAEEVAEMYASLDDPQEYLIHDVRFHRTIARAAGNPILAALMETITANLYENRQHTVHHSQDLKESAEMHREIFRAIRTRNGAAARRTMEQHLNLARVAQDAEASAAKADAVAAPEPRTPGAPS
ncbi:MAG: FadR/GntR family transcriptional regulator [Edaphobacter sp.]|uniref:FadR/GntR family transcriptional regulator n=1 Tax=Edaphobacter sp. TaxID=1934404 RepID=UPI00238886E0|nr:FadR/GntR family transcriptional regulator [Edaphobacter sp.]MDE1177564.1 FadR/GntR family transcriptional regulator [Edaphobacter sp.]